LPAALHEVRATWLVMPHVFVVLAAGLVHSVARSGVLPGCIHLADARDARFGLTRLFRVGPGAFLAMQLLHGLYPR
jgi:hypothetical protein